MRCFFYSALMLFTIFGFQIVSYASEFFETLYDVPVLLDLEEIREESMLFDKPSGRIASAKARSAYGEKYVFEAYGMALPQMGWQKISETRFKREGEVLSILAIKSDTSSGSGVLVSFSLKPAEE